MADKMTDDQIDNMDADDIIDMSKSDINGLSEDQKDHVMERFDEAIETDETEAQPS